MGVSVQPLDTQTPDGVPERGPVIRVRNFRFAFAAKDVLSDVSFEVHSGQFVAIVGPNGAGKTTLVKCLDRILRGGSGQIEICGRALEQYRIQGSGSLQRRR